MAGTAEGVGRGALGQVPAGVNRDLHFLDSEAQSHDGNGYSWGPWAVEEALPEDREEEDASKRQAELNGVQSKNGKSYAKNRKHED